MMGLPVAKSGVCDPSANELVAEGSSPLCEPLFAPLGLEMVARLSTSKTSTRNWALNRSLNVKVLNTERSQFLKPRSEEHTSELQSQFHLVCRLLLEKKKKVK